MTRLSTRRLRAIIEALQSRLAGEIDVEYETDTPDRIDYEKAQEWAEEQLIKRAKDDG